MNDYMRRSMTGSLDGSMSSVSMQELPNLPGVRRDVAAINPKLYKQFKASKSALGSILEGVDPPSVMEDEQSLMSYFDEGSKFDYSRMTATPFPSDGSAYNDITGRYSLVSQQRDRLNKSRSLPYTSFKSIPSFVTSNTGRVSIFVAYFNEAATDTIESRARSVEIKFYHEDSSLEIIEPRIENSGIVQGKFLKRHQVYKPNTPFSDLTSKKNILHKNDLLYSLDDFRAGNVLEIYHREYTIVDCDAETKRFMTDTLGVFFGHPLPLPANLYDPKKRSGGMLRASPSRGVITPASPSGASGGNFSPSGGNSLMSISRSVSSSNSYHPGSPTTVARKKGQGFFEYDRKVLRFFGVWDSRSTLFGDQLRVKLHYTLADDMMEIIAIADRNSGRDPMLTLLKKSVVMKKEKVLAVSDEVTGEVTEVEQERPYHWTDLQIGETVKVASMSVLLIDADEFTRSFYTSKSGDLLPPIELEQPVYPTVKSEIPPYNGFGSEEDSLQTCKPSLIPTAPMKDGQKMNLFQGMILRYKAKLHAPKESDKSREFIIQVHLEDDTFQIREPPLRNSGHKGGIFLSRVKLENHDGSKTPILETNDLHVGANVTILSHSFDIFDCDQFTFKYMEGNAHLWSYSNLNHVTKKLITKKSIIQRLFLMYPALASRSIDVFELANVLERSGVTLIMQEVYTLFRAVDTFRTGSVKMSKMLKFIMDLPSTVLSEGAGSVAPY